jgi:hypothetical protein
MMAERGGVRTLYQNLAARDLLRNIRRGA